MTGQLRMRVATTVGQDGYRSSDRRLDSLLHEARGMPYRMGFWRNRRKRKRDYEHRNIKVRGGGILFIDLQLSSSSLGPAIERDGSFPDPWDQSRGVKRSSCHGTYLFVVVIQYLNYV